MKTDLILVSPHEDGFYKNWVRKTTYQDDGKNEAVSRDVSVYQNIACSQHNALVKTLTSLWQWDVIDCDFPDIDNNDNLQSLLKLVEQEKYDESLLMLWVSANELEKDLQWCIKSNSKNKWIKWYIHKPETKEDYIKNYLERIDDNKIKYRNDSMVYMRDAFISNQEDKILISNFKLRSRRLESILAKEILDNLVKNNALDREIIVNENSKEYFEGWDFRFIPKDKILFAWYSKGQSRNSLEWIDFVKTHFWLDDKNVLILEWKNAFHIDTFFSVVTDDSGRLISWIICDEICTPDTLDRTKQFFSDRKSPLYTVPWEYWIWLPATNKEQKWLQEIWAGIINTLQLQEHLVSSDRFPHDIEVALDKMGVKRTVTPTSEYRKAWGWVHCLTNQL